MDFEQQFRELSRRLVLNPDDGDGREYAQAQELWSRLVESLGDEDSVRGSSIALCCEEAVVLRVLSCRLVSALGRDGVVVSKAVRSGAGVRALNPAVEGLAKTQERLRKVMKEILEQLGVESKDGPKSLPALMQPIIEKAGDILQDAFWEEEIKRRSEGEGTKRSGDYEDTGAS